MTIASGQTLWSHRAVIVVQAGAALLSAAILSYLLVKKEAVLPFAIVGALVFSIIVIRNPLTALALWLVASPLGEFYLRIPYKSPVVTFDRLAILALFAFVFARTLAAKRDSRFTLTRLEKLMCLFSAVLLMSAVLQSTAGLGAVRQALDSFVLPFMLCFVITQTVRDEADFNLVTAAIVLLGLYLPFLGLYEWATNSDLLPTPAHISRTPGFGVRPNGPLRYHWNFAILQMLIFCVVLHRYTTVGPHYCAAKRVLYGLLAAILAFSVLTDLSRTRSVALFAVFAIWLFGRRLSRNAILLRATALCLTLCAAAVSYQAFTESRLYKLRVANRENVYARLAAWQEITNRFEQSPLIGVGFRSIPTMLETTEQQQVFENVRGLPTSHNSYLQMLGELGIVGTSIFALILLTILRYCLRYRKNAGESEFDRSWGTTSFGLMVAYLIPAAAENTMYQEELPNKLFYLLIGLVLARHAALTGRHSPDAPPADEVASATDASVRFQPHRSPAGPRSGHPCIR